jgi:hypothetical protein
MLMSLSGNHSWAQATKTIKIIVPYPPGGTNDTIARVLGEQVGPWSLRDGGEEFQLVWPDNPQQIERRDHLETDEVTAAAELASFADAGEAWRGPRRSATSPRRQVLPNDRTPRLTRAAPAPGQQPTSRPLTSRPLPDALRNV